MRKIAKHNCAPLKPRSAVCLRVVFAAGDGVDDVGHDGVVVVFGDRAARSHAVALGDFDRGQVVPADYREEFRGAHDLEAVLFARFRGFRRVAEALVFVVEHIADLRDESVVKRLHRDAALSEECAVGQAFDAPKSAPV